MCDSPILADVTITLEPADEYRPTASYVVAAVWANVDRPIVHSISTAQNLGLAKRLQRAMLSGAVIYDAHCATDTYGQTYVASKSHVMGRHLNADLKKLGF